MHTESSAVEGHHPTASTPVLVGTLLLWLLYTVIYTLPVPDAVAAVLHLLPGLLAIIFLRATGFTRAELYLVMRRLSPGGIGALALVSLALLGPTLTTAFVGFRPVAVFLLAPASAIAQELYFRAALLPVMHRALPGRPRTANLSHAALFALWHVPRAILFSPINPLLGAGLIALVTGTAGLGWGWQARHDGTIAWTTSHHWLLLAVMSLFGL